jgi:hypothetical protein
MPHENDLEILLADSELIPSLRTLKARLERYGLKVEIVQIPNKIYTKWTIFDQYENLLFTTTSQSEVYFFLQGIKFHELSCNRPGSRWWPDEAGKF